MGASSNYDQVWSKSNVIMWLLELIEMVPEEEERKKERKKQV